MPLTAKTLAAAALIATVWLPVRLPPSVAVTDWLPAVLRVTPLINVRLPASPPRDTTGATVTTSPGVGAHLAHLNQNNLRTNPLACSDCHPANNSHQGTTDFGWSALANGALASVPLAPSYNGATCSSTWCHTAGGTYGGTTLAPSWVGGPSQVLCGSCHGAPPPAPHPANANCNACHPGYATTGLNAAARITHIDGTLQVPPPGACTSCHGTVGRTPVAGLVGVRRRTASTLAINSATPNGLTT